MDDIRTREPVRNVKTIDKSSVAKDNMKRTVIRAKETYENLSDDGKVSPSEFAEDNVRHMAENSADDARRLAKQGKNKAVEKGKEIYRGRQANNAQNEIRNNGRRSRQSAASDTVRNKSAVRGRERTVKATDNAGRTIKQTAKSTSKATVKTAEKTVKATEKTVKTAEETAKVTVKTAKATANATVKSAEAAAKIAQKTAEMVRRAAIAAYRAAVISARAIAETVKAIIAATQKLIAAIAAGGWIAVLAIVVVSFVALLFSSVFGIFFSSEDSGTGMTMQQVVREINTDYEEILEKIKDRNPHDQLEMSGSRAIWPEVLSYYAVKTANDKDSPQEVVTVTEEKKELLEDIFWEMHTINFRTEKKEVEKIVESDDGHGNILEERVTETKTILYITVSHYTAAEMAEMHGFTNEMKAQLEELLSQDASMWASVLYSVNGVYGLFGRDEHIVSIAQTQIGNVGGEPYWSWYGFGSRVEWCGCFVSWCEDQCGYIEMGAAPKFADTVAGENWFKERGQWADSSYSPASGNIIFFDWDQEVTGGQDGLSDHVGIIEKVEDGIVYTIEGNSGDSCRENQYPVGYYEILGYGILNP